MNIHQFLRRPHRFRWGGVGGDDCMTFPATWAQESTGVDPAAALRGTYRTREEAHRILASYGGAEAFMEHHLLAIGATRTAHPETGDIGLIVAVTDVAGAIVRTEIGAIRFGPLWACIHRAGIHASPAQFIAAWRLPA
jgi:hypothetical protein